jgi:hypothetical protein
LAIFKEKEEALELVRQLPELLDIKNMHLSQDVCEYFDFLIPAYDVYVRAFNAIAHTAFLVKKAENTRKKEDAYIAMDTLKVFDTLRNEIKSLVEGKGYSNEVEWCMDYTRLHLFCDDAERILKTLL